jgi:hypothetical protein
VLKDIVDSTIRGCSDENLVVVAETFECFGNEQSNENTMHENDQSDLISSNEKARDGIHCTSLVDLQSIFRRKPIAEMLYII